MPPPFDTVISIGGQSLVDGIWRLLGPALEGLSNPLPLPLPGFSNSAMRITRIIPVIPGTPLAGGALQVRAIVELNAEALLNVTVAAGDFSVSLGPQPLQVTDLAGTIDFPQQTGDLTNIKIGGTFPPPVGSINLGPGTGTLTLPAATATLTDGSLTGTLGLPGNLAVPGIPMPAVVPIPIDLTPSVPLEVDAMLRLTVTGINPGTHFGLFITVDDISVSNITLDPALDTNLAATLDAAITQLVTQLGISITPSPVTSATVTALLAPVPTVVQTALADAFSMLLGATGRLIYPLPGAGASCDVVALPTVGDVQLVLAPDGTYVLQAAFSRPTSSDIAAFPAFAPSGIADTTLLVGNMFLIELLCCLVQRLPAFTFPMAAVTSATDVNGAPHVMCCNFTGATVELGPVALNGGLSLCLDGTSGSPKTITLVGRFAQTAAFPTLTLADIIVDFTAPLSFDLDDAASLANLRVLGPATVAVKVDLLWWVVALIIVAGASLIGPAAGVVAVAVLFLASRLAASLLTNAVSTILRAAALVRSPAAVPPGVFEAFGNLVPVTVSVDDLTAESVLQTPTSPWALLPRIVLDRQRPPGPNPG